MTIVIDDTIKQAIPNCHLGFLRIQNVQIKGTPPALVQEFLSLQTEIAKAYNLQILSSQPRIAGVRSMLKKMDCDPSRYRPASEALVRRILQNKGLHFVNSAVDVNNFCSVKFMLPFGLYDEDKIEGPVTYTLAEAGDYENIAGNVVSTDHKPFLKDQNGVFGNPTADSRRTAVTLGTKNLLSVIYADEEVTEEELATILDFTGQMLVRFNGGIIVEQAITKN